jgi:hypothetical protein
VAKISPADLPDFSAQQNQRLPEARSGSRTRGGAWLAPLTIPVLSVSQLLRYLDKLPFEAPCSEHRHLAAALPQHYAGQFGWEEMALVAAKRRTRALPTMPLGPATPTLLAV